LSIILKIAFTLFIRSTEVFRSHIESGISKPRTELLLTRQYQLILTELLKNTVQLTRMATLSQLSLSRSYDLLYTELVGRDLLSKFLIDSANSQCFTLYPNNLYQYYIFEGVWRGWIMKGAFEAARFNRMESLLARQK
jgi:hypothetical protein